MDKHINPAYQQNSLLKDIKKAFKADKNLPSVQLGEFLTPDGMKLVAKKAKRWKHSAIPDKHSRATCKARLGLGSFVKAVSGKKPLEMGSMLFRHRDFTLIHDDDEQEPGVLAFLFLTDWDESFGGDLVFMKNGEMLGRVTPKKNTLVIVHVKQGVRMFIKYVNHHAGKNGLAMIAV